LNHHSAQNVAARNSTTMKVRSLTTGSMRPITSPGESELPDSRQEPEQVQQ
jgi:hypothetical protein